MCQKCDEYSGVQGGAGVVSLIVGVVMLLFVIGFIFIQYIGVS